MEDQATLARSVTIRPSKARLDESASVRYILHVIEVRRTEQFMDWLGSLRDARAVAKIAQRLRRVAEGNFGDWAPVGEGVSELRIHYGRGL
jgi:hypothetical protein